jgi:hypothetical protein
MLRLKLAVVTTLKSYCDRPDGEYPPAPELLILGSPDMPLENIKVKTKLESKPPFKNVLWSLLYRRLALNVPKGPQEQISFFDCSGPAIESTDKEYTDAKSYIMGMFANIDDPPSKANHR